MPMPMPTPDPYDTELLAAFESGELKSVATPAELAKFLAHIQPAERGLYAKAAARRADTSHSLEVNLDQL